METRFQYLKSTYWQACSDATTEEFERMLDKTAEVVGSMRPIPGGSFSGDAGRRHCGSKRS